MAVCDFKGSEQAIMLGPRAGGTITGVRESERLPHARHARLQRSPRAQAEGRRPKLAALRARAEAMPTGVKDATANTLGESRAERLVQTGPSL